ncbi:STAS domain-containing protein [Paludisphaera mucosa]|uniref:STAS domain-containing protein n=1 Tax=Paludisphaera mucosa TaxID=3030827 RepID=A0ABT6FHI2_9BACT|nr:STAS domain-containing protein [Paludisphaera mucosa]MDG3007051.1 STAS domain-containing protein [Paludisphaera mucosa]
MALNIRLDDDVTILSNFGRLMNDPKHVDAALDVQDRLDLGERAFIMEMNSVHETGAAFLGLLMTITRTIRKRGGDVVLARPSPAIRRLVDEMQMDDFWDVFDTVDEAKAFYHRHDPE